MSILHIWPHVCQPACLKPAMVSFLQWSRACASNEQQPVLRINEYPWGRKSPAVSVILERALSSYEF